MCISFSFLASKRKRNAPKEKEKTLISYALRAFRSNGYIFQLHRNWKISLTSQTCTSCFKQCSALLELWVYRSKHSMLVRQLQDDCCLRAESPSSVALVERYNWIANGDTAHEAGGYFCLVITLLSGKISWKCATFLPVQKSCERLSKLWLQ